MDCPDTTGAVSVNDTGPVLTPIFSRGSEVSAGREPNGNGSMVPEAMMLPGPIWTVRLAGLVGVHAKPSTTGEAPRVAWIR